MAGCMSHDGVELRIYDTNGNCETIPADNCKVSVLTAKPDADGDCNCIKELYLAPDEPNLFALLTAHPPATTETSTCCNTSTCNREVKVAYIDSNGKPQGRTWACVTAEGYPATVPHMSTIPFLIFKRISVTDTNLDDPKNSGHPLFEYFNTEDDRIRKITRATKAAKAAFRASLQAM